MKQIVFDDPYLKKNVSLDNEIYIIENQSIYLYNLYHNIDFSYNHVLRQEIKKKHSSYKSQDKKKLRIF